MDYLPLEESQKRIAKLQERLAQAGLEAALIVQNVDLYYFTGTAQNGYLWVPAQGRPLLAVRKDVERARREAVLEELEPLMSIRDLPALLKSKGLLKGGSLGLEMDVLPARDYLRWQEFLPDYNFVDISGMIREIRAEKSPYEIEILKKTAKIHDGVYGVLASAIRSGVTDLELVAAVEVYSRIRGHLGLIRFRGLNQELFMGFVGVGASAVEPSSYDSPLGGKGLSPTLPQGSAGDKVFPGQPILADVGGNYWGYIIDQTRIFALDYLPEDLAKAHEVALAIQQEVVRRVKPGVTCGEVYAIAREMAEQAGLADYFMGYGEQVPYVGHGVGLELNEFPVLARGSSFVLKQGMVFALEPKFIFPGRGVVGIENDFVVQESGLEKLTLFPDEVRIIQSAPV